MALTPQVRASWAKLLARLNTSPDIRVSFVAPMAVITYPTPFLRVTNAKIVARIVPVTDIRTTNAKVLAFVKGRTENRRVRAWGFTVDGHDFYVIRLGEDSTLVYDDLAGEWYEWNGESLPYWRAHIGAEWVGQDQTTYAQGYAINMIAGDDTYGILWQLMPEQGYDDEGQSGTPSYFTRQVTGHLPMRLRATMQCGGVYLAADMGRPVYTGASVSLSISDDGGETYTAVGSVEVVGGEYTAEIAWRSLGIIRAPGRLFLITDDGATSRIDGLDMPGIR